MEDGYDVGYNEGQMDAQREVKQLKAENERLKKESVQAKSLVDLANCKISKLKAENERLRKAIESWKREELDWKETEGQLTQARITEERLLREIARKDDELTDLRWYRDFYYDKDVKPKG